MTEQEFAVNHRRWRHRRWRRHRRSQSIDAQLPVWPADTSNVHAGSGATGTAPASVAAEASS